MNQSSDPLSYTLDKIVITLNPLRIATQSGLTTTSLHVVHKEHLFLILCKESIDSKQFCA